MASGLAFDAEWFGSGVSNGNPGDFFVSKVGPDANGGPPTFPSWGYAVNYTTANVGGCQIALAPGAEVLWAYNYFNLAHLLVLSGPASVEVGVPFTVHVADGRTGEPVAGASIGTFASGTTTPLDSASPTDASGNALVTLPSAGSLALKAVQAESVRSNALGVCVHAGDDGTCGANVDREIAAGDRDLDGHILTGPSTALVARVLGIANGRVYSRRSAPRVLRGIVDIAAGGTLRQVRIRLQRRAGRRCFNFNGVTRALRALAEVRCGGVLLGRQQPVFTYLLPSRLPAGRYCSTSRPYDATGTVTRLAAGVEPRRLLRQMSSPRRGVVLGGASCRRGPAPSRRSSQPLCSRAAAASAPARRRVACACSSRATSARATVRSWSAPQAHGEETVMSLLTRNATVATRYSAAASCRASTASPAVAKAAQPVDWFYYVNGVEASKGAAATNVHPGDHVWWDRHDWSQTDDVPAVVGSFPQPFLNGIDGKRLPVRVECAEVGGEACTTVTAQLRDAGRPGGRLCARRRRERKHDAARARRAVEHARAANSRCAN